jgi:hypothetical protein
VFDRRRIIVAYVGIMAGFGDARALDPIIALQRERSACVSGHESSHLEGSARA